MPTRLPFDELLIPVRQTRARASISSLKRHAAGVLLLPLKPAQSDWRALPHGTLLRRLHEQRIRRSGDTFQVRVGPDAQTQLLVVCVAPQASTFERLQAAGKWARAAMDGDPASLLIWQQGLDEGSADAAMLALIAALQAAAFRFASFKSRSKPKPRPTRIEFVRAGKLPQLDIALATAGGNNLARWLTALPPNYLDARGYRRLAEQFAKRLKLTYKFYGEPQLKRLGAGAFLAVSAGNTTRDAGIVQLTYRPRGATSPAVSLVGKGICFDTGGTNLKSHKSMLDMHTDMEGSAVALGSLYALHALNAKTSVDCWLAITENRIGPLAYKPQDVIQALNGTTIQVIHTDAEGRMVLADTLSLAARKNPQAIIDYATLTGACVHALTERYSGAFTNRPDSRAAIEAAGSVSGERVWCFPMDADFDSDLDSGVADIMQCAVDGKGDHILAARFLSRFVPKDIAWLHVDLSAGTRSGGLAHIATDITGFGVRFTTELLRGGWPKAAA
jgi:leucyl aminopeptidase